MKYVHVYSKTGKIFIGPEPSGEYVDIDYLAMRFNWKVRTIRSWIKKGIFPKPYRTGRLLRWKLKVIDEWVRQGQSITPTDYSNSK